jgi:hypothetical protein
MAIKKMTSAKKPVAKMATKAKSGKKPVDYVPSASAGKSNPASAMKGKGSLPKSATMKSRGSKTAKQMGDMNQMESTRLTKAGKVTAAQAKAFNPKQKVAEGKSSPVGVRNMQRAGGSKNLSNQEMYSRRNAKSAATVRKSGKGK